MPAHDREVAGIRCTEVLGHLSAYLDSELPPEVAARIQGHLRGCDWCERFGGEFSTAVTALRQTMREAAPVEAGLGERLRVRLRTLDR